MESEIAIKMPGLIGLDVLVASSSCVYMLLLYIYVCVYALYIQYIPLYSRFLGQLCHHMFLLCVLMAFAQEGS